MCSIILNVIILNNQEGICDLLTLEDLKWILLALYPLLGISHAMKHTLSAR